MTEYAFVTDEGMDMILGCIRGGEKAEAEATALLFSPEDGGMWAGLTRETIRVRGCNGAGTVDCWGEFDFDYAFEMRRSDGARQLTFLRGIAEDHSISRYEEVPFIVSTLADLKTKEASE